jgi:magnesium transporter
MMKLFRRTRKKLGSPPGTLEFVGEKREEKVTLTVWDFDKEVVERIEPQTVEECFHYRDTPRVSWINVDGLHDTELLGKLGQHYGLHPLVLEDIAHTRQRPKVEDYGDYMYIVVRMLDYDADARKLASEQLSLVLGHGYLLTFQERRGDVFDAVRERINKGARQKLSNCDYLAYSLLDAVVDRYFVILEAFGEDIEGLEDALVDTPTSELLDTIHDLKRELILLRKSVWPLREVVNSLERSDSDLIRKETKIYLRDLYDHTIQVIEGVESYRDVASGMQDLYLSSVSNKMNEVMKVLTIIATVFIPLSFLAGVYGMNFVHMPELAWRWSYPLFWLCAIGVGGSMIAYFRRKGWL